MCAHLCDACARANFRWDSMHRYLQWVLYGHTDNVTSVTMNKASTFAVTTSEDNTACLWRLKDGQLYSQMVGHTDDTLQVSDVP